jgi:hypothetical protein
MYTSSISKNSVHDSLQRCYVIHGTNGLTIQENVSYNTTGHCYFLEDGLEINNRFINNVGITAKAPVVSYTSMGSLFFSL